MKSWLEHKTTAMAVAIALMAGAFAHPGKVSYSKIEVGIHTIRQELRMMTDELSEVMEIDLDSDGVLSLAELQSSERLIEQYFARKIVIESGGVQLPLTVLSLDLNIEEVSDADPAPFLHAELQFESPAPIADIVMRCRLLDDADERHDNFAKITIGEMTRPYLFTPKNEFRYGSSQNVPLPSPLLQTVGTFGIHGFWHILHGFDHLLFLIGLLLVATCLRMTVGIVTAFTIGHSISLALAALQVVSVPRSLLESVIALTIMWVAVENIFSWFPLKRWLLSLGFGLIHGLAFAETLDILGLPAVQLVLALFSFNLGIEIAQLLVVLVAVPIVLASSGKTWRPQTVQAISLVIFAFATLWFVQRALGLG